MDDILLRFNTAWLKKIMKFIICSSIFSHCYQSECDRRVWFTAAGSPELLLEPTSGHPDGDSQGERDPSSGKEYWHKVRDVIFR